MREKLIELVKRAITDWEHGDVSEYIADHLLACGVTIVEAKKQKPLTNLANKCGSCAYSEPAYDVFGNSTCYVRCTNQEHLNSRRYYGNQLTAVRQRTAKACKRYVPKSEPPEEGE